jgi:hypothetical protein
MAVCSQTPIGQFKSDAASCFDHIVMLFVFTTLCAWGAPVSALCMWELALYHIVHSVKTTLSVSPSSYHYTPATPVIDPGQGSRSSPAACPIATFPLLTSMDWLSPGISFTDPMQQLHYLACAKISVDDNKTTETVSFPGCTNLPIPLQFGT